METAPPSTSALNAAQLTEFLDFCTNELDLVSLTGDKFDRQLAELEIFWRNQQDVTLEPIAMDQGPRECPTRPTVYEFIGDEAIAADLVNAGLVTMDLVEWFSTLPPIDKRLYLNVTLGKSFPEVEMIIRKIFRRLDCIENLI